ncbi:MAG: NapC/NirT family cytochrome c [Candidatus Eisenbacteria bacterium]|nr:NapC/NirT family cytochrome c [Candidatus Eisenbacteria bacterium]
MSDPRRRHLWPELAYNPITVIGGALVLFAGAAIAIFYFLSLRSETDNPYTGIFTLVLFPAVLVLGLILIPLGMLFEKRRHDRGQLRLFLINLKNPVHLRALVVFGVGTAIFLLVSTIGLYETYHYTESVTFCGETCHVMNPEMTAYEASAHARVACVHCHVGPGGDDYLKSKLAGARQLWHFARGDYQRPIGTPVYTLRPARETCEECHWSDQIHRATVLVRDHYLSDRYNRRWRIELLFNTDTRDSTASGRVGTGPTGRESVTTGTHWHMAAENAVTYVASDSSRQSFEQVTWTKAGQDITYSRDGAPISSGELASKTDKGLVRTMDCLDCHNRPAHRYLSPVESVNRALTKGTLDPDIPWIKREAVRALSGKWETTEAAHAAIAGHLESFYKAQAIPLPVGAIEAVQGIHDQQMFPSMRVAWDVYPENQGHLEFAGCFRCHGSALQTATGERIRADCNLCHVLLSQDFVDEAPTGRVRYEPFRHPIEIQGAETALQCTDCHGGDARLYQAQK